MKTSVSRTALPLALVAALTLPLGAHATDFYWNVATPSNSPWSTPADWTNNAIPSNGDNVNFGITPGVTITGGTMYEDLNVNVANFNSQNPNAFTVQVQAGNTLTLNNITLSGAANNNVSISGAAAVTGPPALAAGAVALGSNAVWSLGGTGGNFSGISVSAPISGAFSITKTGTRLVTLSNSANTFSGGMINQSGSVFLQSFVGNGNALGTGAFTFNNQTAVNVNLAFNAGITTTVNNAIVNNNTNTGGTATVQVGSSAAFFTYNATGPFSTGANFLAGGLLNFVPGNGNALATASATMNLTGDFSAYASGATADGINLNSGGSLVIGAQNSIAPTNYRINANNNTTEAGKLILGGAYTMAQKVTINNNANTIRNSFGTRTVGATTATLSGDSTGNALVLTSAVGGGVFAQDAASRLAVTGIVSGAGAGGLRVNDGYTFSSGSTGTTSGTNTLQTPTGTVVLSGVNTYTGGTQVANGTLLVNNATGSGTGTGGVTVGLIGAALTNEAGVTVVTSRVITGVTTADAATLQIGQSITGSGIPAGAKITGITLGNSTNNSTVTIDQTTTAAAANVAFATTAATTTATLGGTGILTMTGTNVVTINAGSTLAPGTATTPSILSIGGTQTTAPTVVDGTATVNLLAGSNFSIKINGAGPGAGYDQLNVTGTVAIGGGTFNLSLNGFTPTAMQKFVIINNDGSDLVLGTFNNLGNGAVVTANNGQQFTINYNVVGGTDGIANDVVLTAIAVPEPGTWAMLAAGLGLLGLGRLRRTGGGKVTA